MSEVLTILNRKRGNCLHLGCDRGFHGINSLNVGFISTDAPYGINVEGQHRNVEFVINQEAVVKFKDEPNAVTTVEVNLDGQPVGSVDYTPWLNGMTLDPKWVPAAGAVKLTEEEATALWEEIERFFTTVGDRGYPYSFRNISQGGY